MSRLKARLKVFKLKRHIKAIKKLGFDLPTAKYPNMNNQNEFSNLAAALRCPITKREYGYYSELTFTYADLTFCYPLGGK